MAKPIKELKQTKTNALFLFTQGYGLISIPLALENYISVAYFLVVMNLPPLKALFPNFYVFLLVGVIVGPLTCAFIGFIYVKSVYFRANYEVTTDANPYSFKLMPKDIPLYIAVSMLCEKEGLVEEAEELNRIIKNSM
jgi:hypothetical protein